MQDPAEIHRGECRSVREVLEHTVLNTRQAILLQLSVKICQERAARPADEHADGQLVIERRLWNHSFRSGPRSGGTAAFPPEALRFHVRPRVHACILKARYSLP